MAGSSVRRLHDGDIDRAIALTDLESWGYAPADFRRLLALSPDGCFAAEADGHVVGVLTTTPYGKIAYLGAVIVDPEHRGRGIGTAMMDAALDHLERTGVETVRLNAYVNVVAWYEDMGFRREYDNFRWEGGPVPGSHARVRPARISDLDGLAAFDASYFGASREALLERLFREFPHTFLLAEDDAHLSGYLVGNTAARACEIGPWIVEPGRNRIPARLFHGLVAAHPAETYAFSAPSVHEGPHRFARDLGFRESFRSVRMVRGRRAYEGDPQGIWSFAGLEKG